MKPTEMKSTPLKTSDNKNYMKLLNHMLEEQESKQQKQPIVPKTSKERLFGDQSFLKEYNEKEGLLEPTQEQELDRSDFINKNTNLMLLFFVVLAVTILVGSTVYYQNSFDSVNEKYNEKFAELSRVSEELKVHQLILNQTKTDLSLKAKREEDFTEKYQGIKGEKEDLEVQIKNLQNEKDDLSARLQQSTNTIDGLNAQLSQSTVEVQTKERKIQELSNEVQDRNTRIRVLKDQLTGCKTS